VPKLEWNLPGARIFEAGVDRVVLYPQAGPGVAWNGVTGVDEQTSGGGIESLYYDGVKYLDIVASEDFQAQLTAYSSPREFDACEGRKTLSPGLFATQQPRQRFGFSYRTLVGNDLEGVDFGYKLHIVWNCMAAPTNRSSSTLSGTPAPGTKQWDFYTVPPEAATFKPTAHFVIDSTQVNRFMLEDLERFMYGTDSTDAALPTQDEVIAFLANVIEEPLGLTI
jgi:hypothetical protein